MGSGNAGISLGFTPSSGARMVRDQLFAELLGKLEPAESPQSEALVQYQKDPVAFGKEVLGHDYPDMIKELFKAVVENEVVIAQSANSVGKSYGAADIALFFARSFPKAEVYMTAAPPEKNLKRILWDKVSGGIKVNPAFDGSRSAGMTIYLENGSTIDGLTIPGHGDEHDREARFCADADDLFEMRDGSVVTHKDLIGKKVPVKSVDAQFNLVDAEAEFFDNGVEKIYEITFGSGLKIRRTSAHPLYVGEVSRDYHVYGGQDHRKGRQRVSKERWRTVGELQPGQVALCAGNTEFNFGVDRMNPDEVKVLAYLIGDGCVNDGERALFFQEDNRQLAEFKQSVSSLGAIVVPSCVQNYAWRVNGDGSKKWGHNPVITLLKKCGVSGKRSEDKRIPDCIFKSDRETAALFLSRLLSTDGWASLGRTGKYLKPEIGYASKNEDLVRDIQRLLLRFGIWSRVQHRNVSWTHKGVKKRGESWSCLIYRAGDIQSFAEQINIFGKEDAVAKCVEYASGRMAYAAWRDGAAPGLKWDDILSVELIGERSTVGVYVPGYNTYLTNIVEHNSGKHAPFLLFIVDEGDAVPDAVYTGIDSCMSGGMARLLVMFNPRHKHGRVYKMIKDREAVVVKLSAFEHPNVVTGDDLYPGAVTREKVAWRINAWTRRLPPDDDYTGPDVFTLPEFMEGYVARKKDGTFYPPLRGGRYRIENPQFAYKVLGEYPVKDENVLIEETWIDNAVARWKAYVDDYGDTPPEGAECISGVDPGELGADKTSVCHRYGAFVKEFNGWGGVDMSVTNDRAEEECRSAGAKKVFVDANGVGAGVAPALRRVGLNAVGVKTQVRANEVCEDGEFDRMRDQLLWQIRLFLKNNTAAMLPDDDELREELTVLRFWDKNGRIKVTDKDSLRDILKRSPNKTDALALTFAPHKGYTGDVMTDARHRELKAKYCAPM